jgi:UDP-N-acetylglucosamine acyltransferase
VPNIHPTAIVDAEARIAASAEIGPFCIVERDVEIGEGSVLRSHSVVRRYTTLGEGNFVDSHVVLGGEPQDLKFDPATGTRLEIGDCNVFREHVTVSRATTPGGATRIGSGTYWMAGAHAGHDATISDGAILINGAAVAGHAVIGPRTILSANCVVHQFTWVGEGVMSQGQAGISQHVPPFTMIARINNVAGLNTVGLQRNDQVSTEDRKQVRDAFRIVYRSGLRPTKALEKMNEHDEWGPAASRFRQFVHDVLHAQPPHNRGLCPMRGRD